MYVCRGFVRSGWAVSATLLAAVGALLPMAGAVVYAQTAPATQSAAQNPPTLYQSDGSQMLQQRNRYRAGDAHMKQAVARLLHKADEELADGPWSVTTKKHPLPGVDLHEYVSVGPYNWPNPNTPDGLPYIRKDGVRNPDADDFDVVPLSEMSKHAYTLAVAGYYSGEERYSQRAAQLLRVFFLDPATRMNPDFEHAQMIRGVNEGRHAGMIESRRLLDVIDAVQLLEQSPSAWSAADDQQLHHWFGEFTDWMQNSKMGHDEYNAPNNHGTWYDVQLVSFRLFLHQPEQARPILEAAKTKRIAAELKPDGSAPKELARTKSLSYSTFNLVAMTDLAQLGERANVDLWHYVGPEGQSIRASINFLLPYVTGREKWPHQQILPYNPSAMLAPLRRAAVAYHDPAYLQAIQQLHVSDEIPLDDPAPGSQF